MACSLPVKGRLLSFLEPIEGPFLELMWAVTRVSKVQCGGTQAWFLAGAHLTAAEQRLASGHSAPC